MDAIEQPPVMSISDNILNLARREGVEVGQTPPVQQLDGRSSSVAEVLRRPPRDRHLHAAVREEFHLLGVRLVRLDIPAHEHHQTK